jgi:alkaline phosphatase
VYLPVLCTAYVNSREAFDNAIKEAVSFAQTHPGVPVSAFTLGVHQELFSGCWDNTGIFRKTASAMNLAR